MQNEYPAEQGRERLPEPEAERLFARASELDASQTNSSAVTDLRAAAAEAGISVSAFDAALAELQEGAEASVPAPRQRPRRRLRLWALGAAVVAAIVVIGSRIVPLQQPTSGNTAGGVPMVEQPILLRCLSTQDAAELIRPLLSLRANTIVIGPGTGTRVLTVRATPAQLSQVTDLLDKYETGSSSCAPPPSDKAIR